MDHKACAGIQMDRVLVGNFLFRRRRNTWEGDRLQQRRCIDRLHHGKRLEMEEEGKLETVEVLEAVGGGLECVLAR